MPQGSPGTLPRLDDMWLTVDGLRLHALASIAAGEHRPAVVLVHGVAVSSRNMRPTAEAFASRCRVFSPDLPGHGRSDSPRHVLGVRALADSLAGWIAAAALDRPVLLGNSFGCQIIAEMAARHPDRLRAAVLQGPTPDAAARSWLRQLWRWFVNGSREGATQPSVAMHDWRDAGLRRLVGTAHHSIRDRIEENLPHVTVPSLVVRGERDPIVSQRWAETVAALVPAGELLVMPQATHTITTNPS
jgi:pimeloyl-ACP methyl ester carboxylesterase